MSGMAAVKSWIAGGGGRIVVFAAGTRVNVRCRRLVMEDSVAELREFQEEASDVKP